MPDREREGIALAGPVALRLAVQLDGAAVVRVERVRLVAGGAVHLGREAPPRRHARHPRLGSRGGRPRSARERRGECHGEGESSPRPKTVSRDPRR